MSLKLTIITLIATILCLLTTFAAIHAKTEKKATNWIDVYPKSWKLNILA